MAVELVKPSSQTFLQDTQLLLCLLRKMASTSGPKDVGRGVPYERIPETDSLSIDHRSNSASENYGYRKLIAGRVYHPLLFSHNFL